MKTWLLAVVVASAMVPGAVRAGQDDVARAPRVSVAEAKKAFDAGSVLIVDVRDAYSYELGHIPGAQLVPLAELPARAARLKAAGKPVITYCG